MNAALKEIKEQLNGHEIEPLFDKVVAALSKVDAVSREYRDYAIKTAMALGFDGKDEGLEELKAEDFDVTYRSQASTLAVAIRVVLAAPKDKVEWANSLLTNKLNEKLIEYNTIIEKLEPQILLARTMLEAIGSGELKVKAPQSNPPNQAARDRMRGNINPEELN